MSGILGVGGGAGGAGSNTLGMSNLGNTSGTSGVISGSALQYYFAGGNNITLSQSINGSTGTLTISAANETQTVPPIATAVYDVGSAGSTGTITRFAPEDHAHRGLNQFQITGNTSNTSNLVYGSIWLAGGNNITLSQVSGAGAATVTISGPNTVAQSNQSAIKAFGATNTGNTAGNTGVSTGIDWVIAGTNNVTVSESTVVGGPNTLWLSAPSPGGGDAIRGIAAGASTATTNTVNFSNSNNFSFGFGAGANSTVLTGSYTAPVVSNALQDVGTATGSGTNTSRFAADDHVHRGVAGIVGVGTATTFYGSVHLSAGNNITLSTAGASTAGSIAIHGPAAGGGATLSFFEPWHFVGGVTATTTGSLSNLHVQPFLLDDALSFGQVNMIGSASQKTTTAGNTLTISCNGNSSFIFQYSVSVTNGNLVNLVLMQKGSGNNTDALFTTASTRVSFLTNQSHVYQMSVSGPSAGSSGSMSIRSSVSVSASFPGITSGQSINGASSWTTWGTGYTTWSSSTSTSQSSTYNTTTATGRTGTCAGTWPATTEWASNKLLPLMFGTSLSAGEYWLGIWRHSTTSSTSDSAQTNVAAGRSYTSTIHGSNLTLTDQITWAGATNSIINSLGFMGQNTAATMAPSPGHGSFSGTWDPGSTYLNAAGQPNGAIALSHISTQANFFRTWFQMASIRI